MGTTTNAAALQLNSRDLAATRAAVSGGGNLGSIFAGVATQTVTTHVMAGDSNTENLTGGGIVPYAIGASTADTYMAQGAHRWINFGASGSTSDALLSAPAGSKNNGGAGNDYTPEGVGAYCRTAVNPLVHFSIGTNDYRQMSSIAGTYGNAAMVAAAKAVQANIKEYVRRVRAAAGFDVPFLFSTPNPLTLTGSAISSANGFTGQAANDALWLTYMGDAFFGVAPLVEQVTKCEVFDVMSLVFGGKTAPALAAISDQYAGDGLGLHVSSLGGGNKVKALMLYLCDTTMPLKPVAYTGGIVSSSEDTYFDLAFGIPQGDAFGQDNGTGYGATRQPAVGIGDVLVATRVDGTLRRIVLTAKPYQNNNGSYVRWVNGPDGAFHKTDIPAASRFSLYRARINTVHEMVAYAMASSTAVKRYPFRVEAGSNGSVTVRGLPHAPALSERTPLTTDWLALGQAGGAALSNGFGVLLTGATITAVGSEPGAYTIAKSGINFASAVGQFGAVIYRP